MIPRARRRSLFVAMALVVCVGLIVPAAIVGFVTIGLREGALTEQRQQQELQARLDELSRGMEELLWGLDVVSARALIEAAMKSPNIVRVHVVDLTQNKTFVDAHLPERRQGTQYSGERDIVRRGSPIGRVYVEIDDSLATAALHAQRRLYLFTVTGQILVSLALIVLLLNSRIARPLRKLGAFANDLAAGKFDAKIERGHDDEIGRLGEGLERMRDSLQRLFNEQRELMEEREARRTAELANRAKSEFLSNMSHELRTPLNAVLGYTQLLRLDPNLTQRQSQGLSTIQASGEHLLTLIDDILDLSRIEAGKLDLFAAALDLPAFLRVVADIIRVKADEKNLLFVFNVPPDLPRVVIADERRLRQVLLNLLGNAVKFTDQGQVTLTVTAGDTAIEPIHLRFEVRDTGIGIKHDDVQRIFKPFEQVSDAERRVGGAGLGLPISQALVQLMGGHIEVESTPGGGSRFWFEIPVAIAVAEISSPHERAIRGYAGPRRRVLIVDDVRENRSMLVDYLSLLGFETIEAINGQEGVDKALSMRPDLVLMDNIMPVMTGLDAIRLLRKTPASQHLPIIAVSASASDAHQEEARAVGADEFLTKPIELRALTRAVGALLRLEWV